MKVPLPRRACGLDLDPSSGIEQTKRRPEVVISNDALNCPSGLRMVIPISQGQSRYPLHVNGGGESDEDMPDWKIRAWAQVEQLKSLVFRA